MTNAATVAMARDIREALAGQALTPRQAKLYSQRLRRDMGREGLASFAPGDVTSYLDEAMLLLESGWLERGVDIGSPWRASVKRSAEIIEWLSQSQLRPPGTPLHLLAAAAYQLADYPAMALGHLRRLPEGEPLSELLRQFVRADFPAAFQAVLTFWNDYRTLRDNGRLDPGDLEVASVQHVVMCIGTICAFLRTGGDVPVERAVVKLEALALGFLHSRDSYSYLLAKLTAASARRFIETCLWPQIERLRVASSGSAGDALTQFARSAFVNRRALVWPAQAAGIAKLQDNTSFVLCTPTGSGKTTVATLGAVQGLFADAPGGVAAGNLVLYLVPSRALAAEVEGRLAEDLRGIAVEPVVVTGLYGGVDWGPTDAWVQTDQPTVVICTFEKADALLRYLGVLFLDRVRTIIIDEAHMVEQDETRLTGLSDGTSRSFRLEQLGSRLLRAREDHEFRIVALSAVAARAAPALARWISNTPDAVPTSSAYRSTRQMLGRLEVSSNGQFAIRYSLMDGHSLKFDDEQRDDSPFVREPFPSVPGGLDAEAGPEVRMRAPTLWAALNLAAKRPDGSTPAVLISLTQNVDTFAATCADLMDAWQDIALPDYWSVDEGNQIWARCLATAIDYFTADSVEYRLLARGIVVHHGKMPGLLARRLKTVIDRGYVRVIIATSTLSEGVNIPVNFLLIPSVFRSNTEMTLQEFSNLIGRAGRPGVATEGSALVILPERTYERKYGRMVPSYSRQWNGYESLVNKLEEATAALGDLIPDDHASSPLAHLLRELEREWMNLTGGGTEAEFSDWLEQTIVSEPGEDAPSSHAYLDSLDAFLIAAIQEVEELRGVDLDAAQLEAELARIWRRTYAFAASHGEARLAAVWLARGKAIKTQYPDPVQRRRLYKTSLTPRSAKSLIERAVAIRAKLVEGHEYAGWTSEQQLEFIRDVLSLLSEIPVFAIDTKLGRKKNFDDWPKLLRWWLAKSTLAQQPRAGEVTNWYGFVANNFIYRGTWGLGSVIGLLLDTTDDGQPIRALEIADWPLSGLPWIAFWLKELIGWGTLDPVAAFLLARGDAIDRPQAELEAKTYYESRPDGENANDLLDPRNIRTWVEARLVPRAPRQASATIAIKVDLARSAADFRQARLVVLPLDEGAALIWLDPAGYEVARSKKPDNWPNNPSLFQFELDVAMSQVLADRYLPHR
ncbi:DEAD/DEAH box helicase [Tardiphaga sp. 862_B3_N4_1]|uniref:DEAD/DEAH box helicase n=1 Tax=Tardiphaga sp. 862_B3_N4_1 TaxID=3240764 RepID=UPI003F239DC5